MSNKSESNAVKILIAVIALISTLGAAAIANWDKIFPSSISTLETSESAPLNPVEPENRSNLPGKPDVSPRVNPPENNSEQRIEAENFVITLRGCDRAANNIRCNLLIESKEDMWLGLRRGRVIDVSGDEYEASLVVFGSEESSSSVNKQLLQGVPIKASLKFDNFSSETVQIAVLQVIYSFRLGAEWSGMPTATEFTRFSDISVAE